ncbi:MAG: hypothetical protein HYY84_01475 [Deltaproteobacteria bacterium]|nr:hypothetical protein [Deltaproteobacteria bacterium]
MSVQDVRAVESAMMAIPADEVRKPSIPVEAYCHQGERIVEATKRDREALTATGIAAETVDTLPVRLGALRTTDAEWLVRRTRGRPPEQVEREAAGFRSRNESFATARFGFRNDPDVQVVLDDIQKGDGVVDMLDDMEKLAVLYREKGARIAIPNFDARKEADRLESEARAIREGSAAWRVEESSETLKERRDRAFTYADRAIGEIRAAARYAFRNDRDDARIAPYVDNYSANAARRTRAKATKAATTTTTTTASRPSSSGPTPTAPAAPADQK